MDRRLTAKEVCLIISSGKDAGVLELKFQGLEIRYGVAAPSWQTRPAHDITPEEAVASEVQAEKYIDNLELKMKTQQMEELPITDPLVFEELIASGDLRSTTDGAEETDA